MAKKIEITMLIDDELVDENDATGVTEEAYLAIGQALSQFGENVDISPA